MLTIAATAVGFLGLVITLTLIQLPAHISFIQLSALAAGAILFLGLTTFGLYTLMDSQTLKIGAVCGAVVILINIANLAKRRHNTPTKFGES
ncbi:hypothetical protein BKG80_02170 [Mycobacteroides chelonae]|jgi:hypothetical protein|uniref:Uncharacterized protein n=1 Tax=Mycobacteroides chelonae TaxID=1774 RepID=A0AB73LMY1_MYCCH|nr:hypothetical protein AOT86_14660 [Mycobacteroides sp. H072]KRQ41373.1 hypothetical protein AOT84_02290 [Mycobacteroides sp. H002]KRQ46203.1 hypothetical protein AOT85_24075 [Mycobacteroides sp. H054]KRQ73731.1 hypothetical protein AOT83_00425 [Mycobacteroides sp. H001]OHT49434.1 hypothetical protein BKG62_17690 [Mycobacteroides chelonae]